MLKSFTEMQGTRERLFVSAGILQVAVLFSTTDSDKNEQTVKDP